MILTNELFWIALSLLLLVLCGFLYKPLKARIYNVLDDKISEILQEINEAKNIKKKAEQSLEKAENEYQAAITFNKDLWHTTNCDINNVLEEAKKKAEEMSSKNKELISIYQSNREKELTDSLKRDVLLAVLSIIEQRFGELYANGKNTVDYNEVDIETFKKMWN